MPEDKTQENTYSQKKIQAPKALFRQAVKKKKKASEFYKPNPNRVHM